MNPNHIFRIPVQTYIEVSLPPGMNILLRHALFPGRYWDEHGREIEPAPQRVVAIKALRALLDCSLKEAKGIVDRITVEMLENQSPI